MENNSDLEIRKEFLEYKMNLMTETMSHSEYNIDQNNFHLHSENGKTAITISKYLNKIFDLIADLDKIVLFLRRFPNKKFYTENDLDELEYTRYHFEVFTHKIHTILEIKKLLVNEFYDIGLSPKNCNWKNLIKNKNLRNSTSSKMIEFYYKSFEHLIQLRHLNTHRAIFNEEKMEDLRSDLMMYAQCEKFNLDIGEEYRRMRPKVLVDYQVTKYRKDKLRYIQDGRDIARQYSLQFENIILKEFFEKVSKKNAT